MDLSKLKIKVEKEKYRFGIVRIQRYYKTVERGEGRESYQTSSAKYIGICNCGQHNISDSYYTMECEKCGNDYFIDNHYMQGPSRFTIPYMESYRRDNRGFKIKRTNLSVVYTGEDILPVQENMTYVIDFDIPDNRLKIWKHKNDVEELVYDLVEHGENIDLERKVNQSFCTKLPQAAFWEFVSTEFTRGLFNVGRILSEEGRYSNRKDNIVKGLRKLLSEEHQWMQILTSAGITDVKRFYTREAEYDKLISRKETKPHKILGIPKAMMADIREDEGIDRHVLGVMQRGCHLFTPNVMRELMSIVRDESTMRDLGNAMSNIANLHTNYGYDNIRKLILYLFREVRLTQGISTGYNASTLLKDYTKMCREMGLEWEKYPKSLKKVHDVSMLNYNAIVGKNSNKKEFKEAVEDQEYQHLLFDHKRAPFAILLPEEPEDLLKEGNELSHCVSSYITSVINKKCRILFLRNRGDEKSPLVTIEVRGKNIRQAKGFANKPVTLEQKRFIKAWAEEKGLNERYY